jgi:hypothetical protein
MRPLDRGIVGLGFIVCLGACAQVASSSAAGASATQLGSPASTATALPGEAECGLVADPGEPIATVAVGDRIDPANAPFPTNDGERLLFRQLYETLVRVDCPGRVHPGLAASWRADTSGRAWAVTLRENARFSDGTPVTAAAILASWTAAPGSSLRPAVSRFVESAVVVDAQTLSIALRGQPRNAPASLGVADLAIARRVAESSWPLGTRGARVEPDRIAPDATGRSIVTITSVADSARPANGDPPWTLRFVVHPGRDPRDFLDERVDLLLTRDPATLGYAATLPQFLSLPLPWQRTYLFLSRWRLRSLPPLSTEARQTLAADAVRGEAKGAEPPFWWQDLRDCEVPDPIPPDPAAPPTGRIVYEGGDQTARDLAERIVGLQQAPSGGAPAILDSLVPPSIRPIFQRAIGLTGDALVSAVSRGLDDGYVVAVDSRPLDPCGAGWAARSRVGWIDAETVVPLVETRQRALVRRGRSGVTAEQDGGLLIARPGARR